MDEEENLERVEQEETLLPSDEVVDEIAQTPDLSEENVTEDQSNTPNDEKISEEEKTEKKEEELDNQWVWYPDDKLVWNRGLVLSSVYVENPKGPGWREYLISISVNPPIVRKIRSDMVPRVDPTHLDDLDNLCLMNDMHEAPLLDLLRRRFERKVIYTYTGDVLISVNPYETIHGLYSNPLNMFNIHPPENAADLVRTGDDDGTSLHGKPHVYQISNKALRSLIYGDVIEDDSNSTRKNRNYFNQSIIISGESGAGKTENSKHVVNFLIEANNFLSHHQSNNTSKEELFAEYLKGILVESSVVLEAFGNAKTVRNDNSSRFGKYIKLLYGATDGKHLVSDTTVVPTEVPKLVSAVIETFLLEKSRLAHVGQGERSYHIFYQLLAGLSNTSLQDSLSLLDATSFRMLSQGGCSSTSEDSHEFQQTLKALQVLQCSEAEILEIWKLLATILHINNLEFPGNENNDPVQVQSPTYSLDQIAENLGVGMEQMLTSLTTQQLIVMKRSSIKVKILSPSDVANNTLALTKWLYSKLFDWIVAKINYCFFTPTSTSTSTSMSNSGGSNRVVDNDQKQGFIGILDIFGFEILGVNSFEQLCINFTNERLQQQFNEYVFVTEQAMYRNEGLQWSNITFRDNQGVIDLIASTKKPLGLLLLLEEQGLLNRKPDDLALLATFNSIHEIKDAKGRVITEGSIYSKSRFGKDSFTIKHFAGDVTYAVEGFLMKNNDSLQDDLITLLNTSTNPFLRNVMKFSDVTPDQIGFIPGHQAVTPPPVSAEVNVPGNRSSTSGKKMASAASVSLHFRQQLDTLMTTLTSTTPNYIKCVKPNAMKSKEIFDPQLVIQQLRYSGVLEVVRIRREGFPVRVSFHAFYRDYEILARGKPKHLFPGPDNCNFEQAKVCAEILATESLPPDAFQIGTSVLFLRQNGLVLMQEAIRHFYSRQLVKIQSKYRSILQRRYYVKVLQWMIHLQTRIRTHVYRRRYQKLRHAALTIKYFYISKRLRQQFVQRYQEILAERRLAAVIRIQSNFRGMQARYAFQKMYKAWMKQRYKSAVLIQCCFRVFSARKLFAYRIYEVSVTKIQSVVRMHLQRMDFLVVRSIVIALQSILRRYIYRSKYLRIRQQMIRLQSCIRRRRQQLQYQQDRQHIILVQSIARRYIHQMQYLLQQVSLICLQTWIRSHFARQRFLSSRQQVIRIQTKIRSWLQWQQYQLLCSATLCLQAFTRMLTARKQYLKILVATITIQAKFRGYFYQSIYHTYRQRIISMQRIIRGYLERQHYKHIRQAIFKLQSFGRMINTQRIYTETIINIIILQSLIRRYLARKYLQFHQKQVTNITKSIRRYLCRRQYRQDYQRIIILQSFGRMINQRRIYQEMIVSAIIIQTIVRGFLQKQWYRLQIQRVIRLQSRIRSHQQRQEYQRIRNLIIKIQSHGRKYIAMMQYAVALVSILCIQAIIRRGTKRRQYLYQKFCIIRIQSHYRKHYAQQEYYKARAAITKITSSYRRYQSYCWYQMIRKRILRIQQAIRRFLLNLHLKQRLGKLHNLLMDNLKPIKGPINNGVIIPVAASSGGKARRRSTNTGSTAATAAAAAASHVLPSHEEILANHIKLMNQVLQHLYDYPEDRYIRIRKQSLKTMLHSLLISSNEELLRALSITCTEIFDVDVRGRNSAHYLAMYPNVECLKILSEIINSFRIPTNVNLDVFDFEDDKDDDKETSGVVNNAMSQMKEALHHSVGNSSLKAGWLKKRRGGMMWQKRWVVLTEDYIIYYKSPQTINNPKYAIPLAGCSVQRLAGSRDPIVEVIAPNMGDKKTLFGSHTKKTMNFLAESEKDLQEWLLPLKAVAGVGTFRSTPVRYINTDLRKLWLNVTDIENETPLHLLIKSMAGLLRSGTNNNTTTTNIHSQYIEKIMIMEDIIAVICWMVEFGCPINAQNLRGETALGIAVDANVDARIVRTLLMKGSDPKLPNVYEITPYEIIHNNPEKKQLYYDALIHSGALQKGIPKTITTPSGTERNYTSQGKLKGYSYLSLYFGHQLFYKASNCSEDPSIAIFVYNEKKQLIEVAKDVRSPAVIAPDEEGGYIYWGQSWHMQTPLENLEPNSYLMIEYRPRGEVITNNNTNIIPIAALHMMFKIDLNIIDSQHVTFELTPLLEMHKQLNPILLQQEKSNLQAELILTQRNRVVDVRTILCSKQ